MLSEIYKTKTHKIPKNKEIDFTYESNDKEVKGYLYYSIDNNYNKSFFNFTVSCENITGPAIKYYNNNNYYIYYCFKNNSDEFHKNDSDSSEENRNSKMLKPSKKQESNKIIIYIIISVIIILLVTSIFIYKRYLAKVGDKNLEKK